MNESENGTVKFSYDSNNARVYKEANINGTEFSKLYLRGTAAFPIAEITNMENNCYYVYGPNGIVAKIQNDNTYFVVKDHLGSTRLVMNDSNEVISNYKYDAFGNLMEGTSRGGDLNYQYTGQEYEDELDLHNFRARFYDSDLMRFYAVDPAMQTASPYLYCGNSPLMYVDEDGEIFFVPILVGMAYGAAIGGTISGGTYAIMAGDDFSWDNFGKAVTAGAIGGAVSGGFGAAGGMLGSLGNNMAYNMLSNTASYAASTGLTGGEITWQGMAGSLTGGAIGGTIPGFSGVEGGALKNITAELAYNSARGALSGGIGGAITAGLSGGNIGKGFLHGAKYGAASSAVQTGLTQMALGHAIKPEDSSKAAKALKQMEKDFKTSGNGKHVGTYKPVYRSGGAYGWFHKNILNSPGIALGRNLLILDGKDNTFVHETFHYYQQIHEGYANFLGGALGEQLFLGMDAYYTPGTREWIAYNIERIYLW